MKDNSVEVTKIIRENRKRFECSEFMFCEDSGLANVKEPSLKVLILFMSNGRYRSSSNTFNILQDIVHRVDSNVLVDFCYFPYPDDLPLYDELDIPYVRGAYSGLLFKDFDVVMISVAVLKEVINIPVVFNHDNIPMGYHGRREKNYPIVAMGGSSAHVLGIIGGGFVLNGVRDTSVVDIMNYGKGEKNLSELILECLKYSDVKGNAESIINSLSNRWVAPYKLKFVYDDKGYIVKEETGARTLLDRGDNVTENFNNKILNLDGSYVERNDVLISYGCNGRGYCSFCLEGTTGGCWKEKDIKEIEKDMIRARFNNWSESCGIFSYNANYHSQIEQIVDLSKKYYSRSSVLMSRADVYSKSTKYIDICKSIGTIKLSIAAEGVSDSIRNDFLNKRLSRDELHEAVHNLMSNQILTIKINYILTGKETKEDFDEWLEDIKMMLDFKKEKGYKTRLFLTITNLVIYDFTPLRYERRDMSIHSLAYKDDDFIKLFLSYSKQISALGVGITLYGSGAVSAFEQLILDLSYMGTSILVNSVVKDGLRYDRDVTKAMCEKFFKRVQTTYNISELFEERGEDSWFASDMVDYGSKKNIKGVQKSYKDISCENCINPCTSTDACAL